MMRVVMIRPGPERQKVVQAPRELVARMRVDGLEQPKYDPDVHRQNMQIARNRAPQNWSPHGPQTENHDFDGTRVLGGEAEGCRVLVVDFVDVFVERAPVHGAVRPVVPGVLEHEEDGDLVGHGKEGWEGDAGGEATELREGVEEPDLGEFDGEMGEEDEFGAVPLFFC